MIVLRRALLSPLILFAAVIGQLVVVNRVPLPGGGVPDLVLLVVTALGVTAGPMTGLLAGFAGGLALDVAPPGGHLAGEYALVYCLAGYACGRIRDLVQGANSERSALTSLYVMGAGVAAGEAGRAALGMMLSDPNVTGPAIRHVLPAAIIYDLLLCPFALWLVSVAVAAPAAEQAPRQTRFPGTLGAFRAASAGAAPPLRLRGSTRPPVPLPVRAEPRLRLAGSSSFSSGTNGGYSAAHHALAGGREVRLNFAGGGASALRPTATAAFRGKSPGKGWLSPAKPAGPAPSQAKSPGKGFVRASAPAGVTSWQARTPGKGWIRPAGLASSVNWQGRSPGKGWLRSGQPMLPVLLTGAAPRKGMSGWLRPAGSSAPRLGSPGKGWIRPAKPPPAPRLASPGKGWLRSAKSLSAPPPRSPAVPRFGSPGRSWLRPARPPGTARLASPGRGWLRPAKPPPAPRLAKPGRGWLRTSKPPKQNWYTRSPSTRWLRRGRRKRLLLGGRR